MNDQNELAVGMLGSSSSSALAGADKPQAIAYFEETITSKTLGSKPINILTKLTGILSGLNGEMSSLVWEGRVCPVLLYPNWFKHG